MSQAFKVCPICGTPSHRNATVCSVCGTTLTDAELVAEKSAKNGSAKNGSARNGGGKQHSYDDRYGETDLFEGAIRRRGETYLLGLFLLFGILICAGTIILIAPRVFSAVSAPPIDGNGGSSGALGTATVTPVPTRVDGAPVDGGAPIVTNTPRPTIILATVTPAPPTDTPSATPGPCMHTVQAGEDLISIVFACGHRSLDVLDIVKQINHIPDSGILQVGQVLEIPWPTPTLDPNAELTPATPGTQTGSADGGVAVADSSLNNASFSSAPGPTATPTLQPGVMWHRIVKDETIISIAYDYGANVKILSELNPEIPFSQCDFGLETGGASCIVNLYEGEMIRVPAPTPTPTLQPSPNGSETATPTATATFNAPSALSPGDRTLFGKDEIITLRWVASGTLGNGQAYRVHVEDQTSGAVYDATTTDLFFIIPSDWQGEDAARHDYTWTVNTIDLNNPNHPHFTTQPRIFTWEGRGVKSS